MIYSSTKAEEENNESAINESILNAEQMFEKYYMKQ